VFLFGLSLGLNIAFVFVHALSTNWLQGAGGPALFGALVGWVLMGAVFRYARTLRERGVLT
jgi:hypothetical protein